MEKAIVIKNLSKRYRIGLKEQIHDTFLGQFSSWIKKPLYNYKRLRKLTKFDENGEADDIIWAIKDISFDVAVGEVVGIIGKNGAGKSTILKILSRITNPTSGRIEIRGRVSSLLEVGTGFHPELTGRENIYLNGTILGMRKKEIDRKFDEIVGFSGVEKFIDTPIKRYSSGMNVRLAFSVAAHLEPEILIIDEVLAVGDTEFQKKCLGKMKEVGATGRTVVFVSHNLNVMAELCKRVILMKDGVIEQDGDGVKVIRKYLSSDSPSGEVNLEHWDGERIGEGPRKLCYVKTVNEKNQVLSFFRYGEKIDFIMGVKGKKGSGVSFGVFIYNELGQLVLNFPSVDDKAELKLHQDITEFRVSVEKNYLNSGTYYLTICVGNDDPPNVEDMVYNCLEFTVETIEEGRLYTMSDIRLPVEWSISNSKLSPKDVIL